MMWARILNTIAGVWLMVAPAVLGFGGAAAINDRVLGPTIASFAVIACWEVTRPLRWINFASGLWLMAAPWILGYSSTQPIINDMSCGCVVAVLSLVRGKLTGSFGGGWSFIWRGEKTGQGIRGEL